MDDDRQLLEAAARAAGIEGTYCEFMNAIQRAPGRETPYGKAYSYWNALDDDGEALRLAVKLRMGVHYETQFLPGGEMIDIIEVAYDQKPESGECKIEMLEVEPDPYAATRRAIVRAAAALGTGAQEK